MAWMRMMGADSVLYHELTVAGRADDPVARAADYYASRGETPMVWGGSGADLLGLSGEVDLADYRAVFGPGGAVDPANGKRLVRCLRPGMELVVSPHKSVAELGVIGRAEDMHAICDAERDGTLDYLDRLIRERGGRRGRAATPTPTGGLTWAVTRHATSRAGDPQVHDHVLIANVVAMRDARGGWKGVDNALLRDHLHAATAVGRMAAAAKAVELGYAVEPDDGRSGRLGSWAIAGIPDEVSDLHSTRSRQIEEAVGGDASYRSRNVAARTTRDRKDHEELSELMGRWRAELAAAGFPPALLSQMVGEAGRSYQPPEVDLHGLAGEVLAPGGRLASEKTFDRAAVIVAVAPHLHGLPVSMLDEAVEAVRAHPDAVRLPAVAGAREETWAAASVLADEQTVADLADKLTATDRAARVDRGKEGAAIGAVEASLGRPLTAAQRQVVEGVLSSGHGLDLVVGVAGSGKTTALTAVRQGFEADGYVVIGTATSGQAAKTLTDGAGIESRTVASLWWRLEHGQIALTSRHVVTLDESGMTADVDVGRILGAVERAGAKMIVVGDDRQLSPVGPGGALDALIDRHPQNVWRLTDNLRQTDPGEQDALAELRSGTVQSAVGWYARNGRIHPQRDTTRAVLAAVQGWAGDVVDGRDAILLAYKRADVELLNRAARIAMETIGRLSGPELTAEDGRAYRAGDQIITLAPGPQGTWVTSQTATVTAVDPEQRTLQAVTPDGQQLCFGPDDIGPGKVDWGYAITAHRSQGATVDTAHVLADGGGRELAYVAMSRARQQSHVYIATPTREEAVPRLVWQWEQQRRQHWITAPAGPSIQQLQAERQQLLDTIPPDITQRIAAIRAEQTAAQRDLDNLDTGAGRWAHTPVGDAARRRDEALWAHGRAERRAADPSLRLFARRPARRAEQAAQADLDDATANHDAIIQPYRAQIDTRLEELCHQADQLAHADQTRTAFLATHPEIDHKIAELDRQITENQRQRTRTSDRIRRSLVAPSREQLMRQRRAQQAVTSAPPDLDVPVPGPGVEI